MRFLSSRILDLPKTIYFNFKVFPFKTAIKLPVLISRHIKTKNLHKGSIEINSDISRFMIKIGIGGSEGQIGNEKGFWLIQKGAKIIFNGSAGFSRGNSIRIDSGYMQIGNNFNSNSFSLYHCVNHIQFGDNVLIGCHVTFRDNDGHTILYNENQPRCHYKPIIIGNNVWICAKVDILKGSVIPNGCVVGYRSCVLTEFQQENCIIAGYPSKVLRENINWKK